MLKTSQVKLREFADFDTRIMLGWPGSEEKEKDTDVKNVSEDARNLTFDSC